ncbi:MAG: redoxin domain-containing protein [Caldilineaceae bacterium]|nr:redoxin domain-containing protein [Caldilineaceae bacterium]MCB9137048.1 redoxin domain-containing protein [Caldilineaceae bacterium]
MTSQSAGPLPVNSTAPDFSLPKGDGQLGADPSTFWHLADERGKNVILAFYPADWSPVCGSQIALYNELIPTFAEYNAEVIGISVDGTFCHKAFKEHNNLSIELLCDFEPKGKTAKLYSAYNEQLGLCERAIYVIDAQGIIRYSYISPMGVNPGAKEILETLQEIQHA